MPRLLRARGSPPHTQRPTPAPAAGGQPAAAGFWRPPHGRCRWFATCSVSRAPRLATTRLKGRCFGAWPLTTHPFSHRLATPQLRSHECLCRVRESYFLLLLHTPRIHTACLNTLLHLTSKSYLVHPHTIFIGQLWYLDV